MSAGDPLVYVSIWMFLGVFFSVSAGGVFLVVGLILINKWKG